MLVCVCVLIDDNCNAPNLCRVSILFACAFACSRVCAPPSASVCPMATVAVSRVGKPPPPLLSKSSGFVQAGVRWFHHRRGADRMAPVVHVEGAGAREVVQQVSRGFPPGAVLQVGAGAVGKGRDRRHVIVVRVDGVGDAALAGANLFVLAVLPFQGVDLFLNVVLVDVVLLRLEQHGGHDGVAGHAQRLGATRRRSCSR
mmetsp:Transcript_21940/g.52215  ORF Transcript_21940/g.52215 Transcript_21940/m.52215 type:complete len:200 (-) Transcript_21940:2354-2953(-)